MERRNKLLSLAVIHRAHVPSIIHSLAGYSNTSYRNSAKILQYCKEVLLPDFIKQLKEAQHHHNQSKLNDHIITELCRKARASENCTSVSKKLTKVEKILVKEERNKHVALFPC